MRTKTLGRRARLGRPVGVMVLAYLLAAPWAAAASESHPVGVPRIAETDAITFIRTMEEVFASGDGAAIKDFYRGHYLDEAEITLTVSARIGGQEQPSQTWTSSPGEQIASIDHAVPTDFRLDIRDIRVALDRQSADVSYDAVEIAEIRISDGTEIHTVETRTEADCTATLVAGYAVMKIGALSCTAVLMPNR